MLAYSLIYVHVQWEIIRKLLLFVDYHFGFEANNLIFVGSRSLRIPNVVHFATEIKIFLSQNKNII